MKRLSYICCVQRIPVSKLPFDTLLGNLTFDIPESYDWPVVKCQKHAKKTIFHEKISSTLALFLFSTEQVRTDANRREILTAYEKT